MTMTPEMLDALTDATDTEPEPDLSEVGDVPAGDAPPVKEEDKAEANDKENDDSDAFEALKGKGEEAVLQRLREVNFGRLNQEAAHTAELAELRKTKEFLDGVRADEDPRHAVEFFAKWISEQSGVPVSELVGQATAGQPVQREYTPIDFSEVFADPDEQEGANEIHKAGAAYTDSQVAALKQEIFSAFSRYVPHLDSILSEKEQAKQREQLVSQIGPHARLVVAEVKVDPRKAASWGGFQPTQEQIMEAAGKYPKLFDGATTPEQMREAIKGAVFLAYKDSHIKDAFLKREKTPQAKGPGAPGKADVRNAQHGKSQQTRVDRMTTALLSGHAD